MIGRERLEKMTNELIRLIYESGRIPNPEEVSKKMRELYKLDLEKPLFEPMNVKPMDRFNADKFNKSIDILDDDLGAVYDEDIRITNELLQQITYQDLAVQSQLRQVQTSIAQISDLILTQSPAVGALRSVFDTFNDLSKVDQDNTTAYVDTDSGTATIPKLSNGSRRIQLPHLSKTRNIPVTVLSDTDIYRQRPITLPKEGSIVDDTNDAWSYQIIADVEDKPVTIELTLDLIDRNLTNPIEPQFSRIDFRPSTWGRMGVLFLYTRDYKNWLILPGYRTPVIVDSTKTSFRFPALRAKAIKIQLTKYESDGTTETDEGEAIPYYHYGIRSLAFYQVGYGNEGILTSKFLVPEPNDDLPISKISLFTEEKIPAGTSIKYEIGVGTGEGGDTADVTGISWSEIAPIGRPRDGVPTVLDLKSAVMTDPSKIRSVIEAAVSDIQTVDGLDYYAVIENSDLPNAVFKTARLWNGIDAWKRSAGDSITLAPVYVAGCALRFGPTNSWQALYVPVKDQTPLAILTGESDTELRLINRPLLYGSDGFPLTPANLLTGEAPSFVDDGSVVTSVNVNYSIERVIHLQTDSEESDPLTMKGNAGIIRHSTNALGFKQTRNYVFIGIPENLSYIKSGRIYVNYTLASGHVISGYFSMIQAKVLSSPDTGNDFQRDGVVGAITYFRLLDPNNLLKVKNSSVSYAISQIDLTNLVKSASGNSIYIDSAYPKLTANSNVLVSYKRMLDYQDDIVETNSVTLFKLGESGQVEGTYAPGIDYSVNKYGIIHALNTDLTDTENKISADFTFRPGTLNLFIFTTYFLLDHDLFNLQLYFNNERLELDPSVGEKLLVTVGGSTFDLTTTGGLDHLPAGLVQVVVYSTDVYDEYNKTDMHSAIYKVVNAVDENSVSVFGSASTYWKRQSAFASPMEQTSYHNLTRNVNRGQRNFFAISGTKVYTNYEPYREFAQELRLITMTGEPYIGSGYLITGEPPGTTGVYRPIFELEYLSKGISAWDSEITGVFFRASLLREDKADGSSTSELGAYSLRFT